MQTQNLQRYIIWGALAAVFVLILIQWDKDYGAKAQFNSEQIAQTTKPTQDTQNIEDIPQVQSTQNKTIEKENNPEQLIELKNETLNLKIDLIGGDIVHAELNKFSPSIENKNQKLVLLENNASRVYVAQSGLIGNDGFDARPEGRPLYSVIEKNEHRVVLSFLSEGNIEIQKIFTTNQNSYFVNVEYRINNNNNNPWLGNLFAQIKRDQSIDPYADTSLFAMKPFLGFAYWSEESKYNKTNLYDLKDEAIKITHQAGWLAFVQHYFISAWVAPTQTKNTYSSRINSKGESIFGFTTETIQVQPNESKTVEYGFYVGPKDQKTLAKISEGLDLTVDYGWLWMIAQPIFNVMVFIQNHVGNWGWSIVLLTCLVKLMFFPLNQYAFKSMANMRKLQPKMQRLKELYGDDRQKLSQATMEMYRKEKINPLGSCLPMLIQMPVFIALYWVLSESVEIRHAEFIGWIKDLSIKDPYFVLPALMAISMWFQQKLSPMVFQDPMQERVMKMMPFMFAIFFLFFPAGLVLYWLVNNILTIAQQWVINKNLDA